MHSITEIDNIDINSWRTLVLESSTATWFQTEDAYRLYASLSDIMIPFVVAITREQNGTERLSGLVVGYVTKEKSLIKHFFTRRAIIIGGPLLADDISNDELRLLLLTVKKQLQHKAIYIETRNFHDYSRWRPVFEECDFAYEPHLNFQVDTSSLDIINANLGKGKKRDIKTSIREGACVIDKPTIEQVKAYYSILKSLYISKVKTPLFPWLFFEELYKQPCAHFVLIAKGDDIIGGTICMELHNKVFYEWFVCGTDGKYKGVFPSAYATYSGMCMAAEHKCAIFDMMGAGKPDEAYGVRDFKAHFGGQLVEYGRYMYLCKPGLYVLGKLGVYLMKKI